MGTEVTRIPSKASRLVHHIVRGKRLGLVAHGRTETEVGVILYEDRGIGLNVAACSVVSTV